MKRQTYLYEEGVWDGGLDFSLDSENTLVICFGTSDIDNINNGLNDIIEGFKNSIIIGCSTAGEIYQDELYDDSLVVSVVKFEKTKLKVTYTKIASMEESFKAGINIASSLYDNTLKAIFILSDGLNVNGSQLTSGINNKLNDDIIVTGGLAGDGDRFEQTWVLIDGKYETDYIVSVGFYGDSIKIAHGSQGGWINFGIDRVVTKSSNNILYELDNKPALEIYKQYLGEEAQDLPASGLLYPLEIQEHKSIEPKVRTILAVDEENQSITFAGDIPQGSVVKFMKASFNHLIDGASKSAQHSSFSEYTNEIALNIAISCVGRKLVLGQKTEDELEAVLENFSSNVKQIGFYSYGEISPLTDGTCALHNQTMTLTLLWE